MLFLVPFSPVVGVISTELTVNYPSTIIVSSQHCERFKIVISMEEKLMVHVDVNVDDGNCCWRIKNEIAVVEVKKARKRGEIFGKVGEQL